MYDISKGGFAKGAREELAPIEEGKEDIVDLSGDLSNERMKSGIL